MLGHGPRATASLENALNGLRGSSESGHEARQQHADQPELIAATDRTILAQRDQLLDALIAVESVAT